MPFVYFLASKFSAFSGRGRDPRTSHDFEDIVYLLDNRTTFVKDILKSEEDVKDFLIKNLNAVLHDPYLQEAVQAHLEPGTKTDRYKALIKKLEGLIR